MFIDDNHLTLCGQKMNFHDVIDIQKRVQNKKRAAVSSANFTGQ